jgi:hypothetical protein
MNTYANYAAALDHVYDVTMIWGITGLAALYCWRTWIIRKEIPIGKWPTTTEYVARCAFIAGWCAAIYHDVI